MGGEGGVPRGGMLSGRGKSLLLLALLNFPHPPSEYYMKGDIVSCQGDPPQGMYLIGEGQLEVGGGGEAGDTGSCQGDPPQSMYLIGEGQLEVGGGGEAEDTGSCQGDPPKGMYLIGEGQLEEGRRRGEAGGVLC